MLLKSSKLLKKKTAIKTLLFLASRINNVTSADGKVFKLSNVRFDLV